MSDGIPIDFGADAEAVRVVAEAERLSFGHMVSPAFGAEIALIDPLPHQRLAVYDHMLPQPRLRFLLADDAGAGKTIMTGLYIREMLSRRLIRRVLIVPPAGLIGNWERELRRLFRLPFRIVVGGEAKANNPFAGPDSDLLIVSVDTLAGDRMVARLREAATRPYDLVVFDEAHKLSADRQPDLTIRRTDRYRLAEALAGVDSEECDEKFRLPWNTHHLLLLSATPHMGKEFPYYYLWRLLEPSTFSTIESFRTLPTDSRARYFLRRTKEEMVYLDGRPIYPTRHSDTLSYELSQGADSEQELYDQTTAYINEHYNRARILNRSAARLAMSIFQRRLASSTWALLRSFERRHDKLTKLIDDIRSGRVTEQELEAQERPLLPDVFLSKTGDEEEPHGGREENEILEERAMGRVVVRSLADLTHELGEVRALLDLSRRVYDRGDESKFTRLLEVLRNPLYRDEKFLIFTEHRDTLDFLVRRLSGLGHADSIARIHGGMDNNERTDQADFFLKPLRKGGARYMVCTDAAAEGINLQVCWLMVNYDIPWNPARLEQRMGRIHRYGQKHDPVLIQNLIAGKTREGRVLKTLLDKLEEIRGALGKDKVFDVIGLLFEGLPLVEYMELACQSSKDSAKVAAKVAAQLNKEQVEELLARQRKVYGKDTGPGDVEAALPELRERLKGEELRRLLPGYVRRLVERSFPLVDLRTEGDLDGLFTVRERRPGALSPFWPALERYPAEARQHFTVNRPKGQQEAIFLHPGEPVFEKLRAVIGIRFGTEAQRGAVFLDPYAAQPYLFHLALLTIHRRADANLPGLEQEEILDCRLVGLIQTVGGEFRTCPVEHLLILRGASDLDETKRMQWAELGERTRDSVEQHLTRHLAAALIQEHQDRLAKDLPVREQQLQSGYEYKALELAERRNKLNEKLRTGDARAKTELTRIRDNQRALTRERDAALLALRREPELLVSEPPSFIVHALILPSADTVDRQRHDAEVEAIAMRVARAHEETLGAHVRDVSRPEGARLAGLTDYPGFDLLSHRAQTATGVPREERAIEVKGRAATGSVELTENEWAQACNLRHRYWLYVVFDCATPTPRLVRVRDPFTNLIHHMKGTIVIDAARILAAAEPN